ncbi:hypothetical protein L7F22_040004 [Adiantum nelumboides]|nr:hypothetical protein [Adiantum nelumboides]
MGLCNELCDRLVKDELRRAKVEVSNNKQAILRRELAKQMPVLKVPPDKQVLISIPGDHSRKPPLASLLSPYVPGEDPVHGLELFARDIHPGWTSWGNEPLRFQQIQYFGKK